MVGDGINDSAVLAQADLGIAMGQGSDIAIDVEKVTILSSDLTKIAAAVRLSAATVRTVRQNLFWAFIYNLIGVPVAAGVLYPLTRFLLNSMLVGAAMALSSVSVVANSLQLSTKRLGTKAVHKIKLTKTALFRRTVLIKNRLLLFIETITLHTAVKTENRGRPMQFIPKIP